MTEKKFEAVNGELTAKDVKNENANLTEKDIRSNAGSKYYKDGDEARYYKD